MIDNNNVTTQVSRFASAQGAPECLCTATLPALASAALFRSGRAVLAEAEPRYADIARFFASVPSGGADLRS